MTVRRLVVAAQPLVAAMSLACAIAPAAGAGRAAAPPRCTTSGLVVWLNTAGEGAAGSVYRTLEFTNESGRSCTLQGYPGISAVDLGGRQVGSPGTRSGPAGRAITLADGATARATLRIAQAVNFPASACRPVSAAGVRVYPPGETVAKIVPYPFQACSRAGSVVLGVAAVAGS